MYEQKQDTPIMVPKDYLIQYDAPCIASENNDYDQKIYRGTGIPPADHPLMGTIPMRGCGHCNSNNVLVLYAQWSVSVHSGDSYWDYEIVCQDCQKFTARSYAEND
ncbi:MAG TPA: hypothetical protein VMZ29_06450 [Candidatus Bathyarchaeia archaeon]|nr:hypothetical protein [Candidatus Bathyarchaeia archaeon]